MDTMADPPHGQAAWRALAVLDAAVLVFVAWNIPWGLQGSSTVRGDYAWLVKPFALAFDLAWNGFAATFVGVVAYAIAREVRGNWYPAGGRAVAASIVLAVGLLIAAYAAYQHLAGMFSAMLLPDRAIVFDALAHMNADGESTGGRLAWIAAAAYLAEKYLLRWWNIHWPVSIAALAIIVSPVAAAWLGEWRQKSWVEAQQWRSVGDGKTWLQAVQACSALGPGWRLPRPHELTLYVASEPEALHGARGKLWTSITFEAGRSAIVVDLQPRLRGAWRLTETPHRDRSTCEVDASRVGPREDWFAQLRPRICETGFLSESMFVSTEQRIAYTRGTRATAGGTEYIAAESTAATVCVNAKGEDLPRTRRLTFRKEEEFRDAAAFLARMREVCAKLPAGSDPAACAAYGGQEPATKATAG